MSLFFAELRKVWGGRVFPALLAILAASNLLLLWMGTRPTAKQPPASAYRAVGAELSDKTMEEKGAYLHNQYTEIESLVKIGQYYRELAYGGYGLTQYRQDNAAMFDAYEQEYTDKTYTLFTDNLNTEYRLFSQLQSEYDTVAAYNDFLDGVQTKAAQLSGISIFQNDRTGYDLKNIELTAQVYAGLADTPIEYYPQKGLYTAISYAFTDLILLAAMLLLALILVRQERDSGLLSLIRSLPGGRLKTAIAKLAAFAASLLVVLMGAVWGQSCILFGIVQPWPHEPHDSKCSRIDALHHADYSWAIPTSVFTRKVGRCVCDGAVGYAGCPYRQTRCRRVGWRLGPAFGNVWYPYRDSCHEPFECHKVCQYGKPAADQRAAGKLPESFLVW